MAKILAESLLMKFTAQYTFFTFNFYIALQEMKVIHDIHALWNKSIISLFLKDISRTNSTLKNLASTYVLFNTTLTSVVA